MRHAWLWSMITIVGCSGGTTPAPEPAPAAAVATPTLEKSPDSGKVDRVGASDGALTPDGTNDLGFVAQTEGPISALFLVAVDDTDKPSGTFQADTLIGAAASPPELGAGAGNGTAGLGVLEGDKVLNANDGSLQALGAGPHRLLLYVAPTAALSAGSKLRLYVLRPDNTLVAGNSVTN